MRYPISPWLWIWPLMWPILLLITAVWTMLHWAPWIVLHLVTATVMTAAILSVNSPYQGEVVKDLGIIWLFAAGHVALYISFLIHHSRSRARRRVYAY